MILSGRIARDRDKSAEIDAKVRYQRRNSPQQGSRRRMGNVPQKDQDRFTYEADVALRDARISFSGNTGTPGWTWSRHLYLKIEKSLVVKSYSTAPSMRISRAMSAQT